MNRFRNKKTYFTTVVCFTIFLGSFFSFYSVNAQDWGKIGITASNTLGTAVSLVLGFIALLITSFLGLLTTILIKILVNVAQFNNIINVETVKIGWIAVRDICNMFFVLIILVIAFATILRYENYSIKRLLPKLLIMAVLINFSRTIFGLIIDFAQVIMLTFTSAFSNGGGWFIDMFNYNDLFSLSGAWQKATDSKSALTSWATAVAIIAGVIASLVTLIVVLVILIVLVIRVVMLWIYTILSPLIFIGFAFPPLQKYTNRIWEDFIKQVMIGPILAFFIWLALTTAEKSSGDLGGSITTEGSLCLGQGSSAFFCDPSLQRFIITIGLLAGGLMVAQQMGGAAGSIAGKGMNWAKKAAYFGSGAAIGKAAGKAGFFKAGRALDKGQMWLQKKAGIEKPSTLNYRMVAQGWKAKKARDLEKYESYGGAHGSLVWQDTFGKYMRLKQYAGWEKSDKRKMKDEERAKNLELKNASLQKRISDSRITGRDNIEKAKLDLQGNKPEIIKDYKSMGYDDKSAAEEFKRDILAVGKGDKFADKYAEEMSRNDDEISKLRKTQSWGASRYKSLYSASGSKELVGKEISAIKQRSDNDYAVVTELLDAYEQKDSNKIMAALSVLMENNDGNEALKDQRIQALMTKEGGLLDTALKNQKVEEIDANGNRTERNFRSDEIEAAKRTYRENSVTPAYAQAMVQGMFKSAKLDDKMAARYANQLGGISFAGGNGLMYAAAHGDVASGGYKFDNLRMVEGKLETSENRNSAIVGKFNNLESQTKMRTLHPDTLVVEAPNGEANGIHESGKEFLKSLTSHDLGQVNRLRLDVINKIGRSDKTLKEIMKLADEVAETDEQQAETIRNFAGYIKGSIEGKGMKKDFMDLAEAGKEAINKA